MKIMKEMELKKVLLTGFVLMSMVGMLHGQQKDNAKLTGLFNKIDSVVYSYIRLSGFTDRSDVIDPKVVQNFKNLFVQDAMVVDEIYPAYFSGDFTDPEKLVTRKLLEYCDTIIGNFPAGLTVKLKNANISFKELENDRVFVVLEKTVKGKTKNGLRIEDHDTVELELAVSPDYKTVKIAGITMIGKALALTNDLDRDFKHDEIDKCPKQKGLESADGCPVKPPKPVKPVKPADTTQKPKRPLEPFTLVSVGMMFGKVNNSFDYTNNLNNAYSNASDFSTNKDATPEITEFKTTGFELGIGYFFDKKMGLGIGAGIQYQMMKGAIKASGFDVTFKATDKTGTDYKQHISSTSGNTLTETFKVNQLSIPVLLMYRKDLSQKIGFQIDAGINLMLNFKGNSTPDDNFKFDYEAVYHYNRNSGQYEYSVNEDSRSDWYMTAAHVQKYNKSSEMAASFEEWQKQGYNVGLNNKPEKNSDNTDFEFKGKMGLVIRPTLYYLISPKIALNVGIVYMTNSYTNEADVSQYYLTKDIGKYNTMMKSIDKVKTSTLCFNIGLGFRL